MTITTTNKEVKLVEFFPEEGKWRVRWNISKHFSEDGLLSGLSYEEETYRYIPTIEDIQQTIAEYYNKETNLRILYGFRWNGRNVYLSDENKLNYKAIIDEAARREAVINLWDKEHPDTTEGRPTSLLPITLKLGEKNIPENFYVFTTLAEIQEFFAAGVQYLIDAYSYGWMQIATFDYAPYVEALANLNNE